MPEPRPISAFSYKPIIDLDTINFLLRVETDPAGMEVRAIIFPKKAQGFLSPESLSVMLREAGIVHGLDQAAIRAVCAMANAGTQLKGAILAKASVPVNGQDESIRFLVQPNSDRYKFEAQENKRPEGETLPLIVNVEKGQELARAEHPTGGVPGMTVFGLPIPARDGAAMKSYPIAGKGVFWDDEAKHFMALEAGRLVFERDTLFISDKFQLSGDVNRRTGFINFVGDIEILGGIQDGFSVKARTISVRGNVGDGILDSSGDIFLGVVNGNYAGFIRCGGSLYAESLNSVNIEVRGNIHLKGFMMRCTVKCGGAVLAQSAKIEGGTCIAFKGVDVFALGSMRDMRTVIQVGSCPFTEALMKKAQRDLQRKEQKLRRLRRMLAPYVKDPSLLEKLRKDNIASFNRLSSDFKKVTIEAADLRAQITTLHEKSKKGNPLINIRGSLLRGAVVTVGHITQELDKPMRSASTLAQDIVRGVVVFRQLEPNAIESKAKADMDSAVEA